MLRIKNIAIKINAKIAKVTDFSKFRSGCITKDVFVRQTTPLRKAEDYLKDVVFESSGGLFPTVKAKFQGKHIATTKEALFKQLDALNSNSDAIGSEKITRKDLSSNFLRLGKKDCKTIARISKFFHEINQLDNENLPKIKRRLSYNKDTLSTINKLLTHSRNFNLDEIQQIVDANAYLNHKYLKILLNSDPMLTKNSTINSCLKNLPLRGEAEKDNINAIQRIREKLIGVDDLKIKGLIESKLIDIPQDLKAKLGISSECIIPKGGVEDLNKCELLLDAYHCENNYYSMLNGETQKYYKHIKNKANPKLADRISAELESNIQEFNDSYKRLLEVTEAGKFNEAVRLEPVKQFIGIYSKDEPEMANYLYEKYFLPKMNDCELKDKCIEINNKFRTKVFVDIDTRAYLLDKLEKELTNWQIAGEGKAQIPYIFDLSRVKQNFIEEGETYTKAFARKKDHSINMPSMNFYDGDPYKTLRHEMTHLNDTEFFSRDGIINDIDFDNIKKNKNYIEQLKVSGINDFGVNYAYTDKKEFIAVAAEGDTREYSDEFKNVLIKLGLPKWAFKLKQLNPPMKIAKPLEDGFINKAMDKLLKKEQNITFPNGIMLTGNRVDLNEVAEWLAEKSIFAYQKIDFNEFTQEDALRRLKTVADVMKEGNTRAIIQIDNFKRFTVPNEENDNFISKLKSFLGKCSDEYNCTIIASVDDASKIDPYLMATNRFQIKLDADGNSKI